MRKPKVENKYNLTIKDIECFVLIDLEKLKSRTWRNNVINAWCYNKGFGKGYYGGSMNDIYICIFDKPYKGKMINVDCLCMEGMCGYIFSEFYCPQDIDNELDLLSQEAVLEFANWLLDEGVCRRGD